MDVFTKRKRSEIMRAVRSEWTSPERRFHAALVLNGLRPDCHDRALPGRPDFVLGGRRTGAAVFLHGCFWHLCPRHFRMPKANRAFWKRKFAGNARRDGENRRDLRGLGWPVLQVWECALDDVERLRAALEIARGSV